jgi:hypothetical protein
MQSVASTYLSLQEVGMLKTFQRCETGQAIQNNGNAVFGEGTVPHLAASINNVAVFKLYKCNYVVIILTVIDYYSPCSRKLRREHVIYRPDFRTEASCSALGYFTLLTIISFNSSKIVLPEFYKPTTNIKLEQLSEICHI